MRDWLLQIYKRIKVDTRTSHEEKLFKIYLLKISRLVLQVCGSLIIFMMFFTQPVDFLIYDPSDQNRMFWIMFNYRSLIIFLNLWAIVAISLSDWFFKRFYISFLIPYIFAVLINGYYQLPRFHIHNVAGLIFAIPIFTTLLPVGLKKRTFAVFSTFLTFIGCYMSVGLSISFHQYLRDSLILFGTCLASLIIGHFLFYRLNRQNFFQQRKLRKTELEAKKAQEQAEKERQRSEELLTNILPEEISERLKAGEDVSEKFENVTVLFADIVGFTPVANELPANEVVSILDEMFSKFDRLVNEYGLEKIKTIGDEYFVAAGVPEPRDDHAIQMANLAIDMNEEVRNHKREDGASFELRMGMNTGSLVAGIIGEEKFVYDVWGDTVNIGSRMESQGEPGKIQVTPATKNVIEEQNEDGEFEFEERGTIEVKGKGEMTSYFLVHK